MIEFAQGYFNLEHPAAKTTVPAGRVTLDGWLVGKPTELLTDLRVRCGGRIWPAVYGFIRADLAAHFKHPTPHLPSAFRILVFLEPGPAALEFEALDISGQWLTVHGCLLEVTGASPAPYIPDDEATVDAHEFSRLSRHLLRLRGANPAVSGEEIARRLAASLPCPRYLLHPTSPFHAFFREPAIIGRAAYGRILVDGYLFHESLPIKRVLATFDLHVWQAVTHGGVSPIAPSLHPEHANAVHSNVKGYIDVPAQLTGPVTLRIYAEMSDGSRHLCVVQQTLTYGLEEEKKTFPPASLEFFRESVRALYTALGERGIHVAGGAPLRQELRKSWRNFFERAPKQVEAIGVVSNESELPKYAPLGDIFVFTQNLECGGAPLLLLEYCRYLVAHGGARISLISAADGELRGAFEAAGARVQRVDITALSSAASPDAWHIALEKLSVQIDCRLAALVVANTLASYWAIHLAHLAGKPSLFYIHESTTPAAFYHGTVARTIIPLVEASFALATRVSFNTAATSHYYDPFVARSRYVLNPGWIDIAAIDAHRAAHSRTELRNALGFPPGRKLVLNLGTVCERKGQHVFAWAVDLLWRRNPVLAGECDFWMVGGRDTAFDRSMTAMVAGLGRPNLRIIPETSRAYDYLGAADVFVCSSYEESFPRVVLEAMAMEVPILSTDVHGIPEMVRHEKEALLVAPGNSSTLADGLARILSEESPARHRAIRARRRVVSHFDSARVLPRQLDLAHQTIAIQTAAR
ncbi:MAG TPA: glycosyltransferase family 4 protein [Lacunisphaera sp.]|jgi:glycosyltransferase involved in cell wall biosynthesis